MAAEPNANIVGPDAAGCPSPLRTLLSEQQATQLIIHSRESNGASKHFCGETYLVL
jgi:hypothetical protein